MLKFEFVCGRGTARDRCPRLEQSEHSDDARAIWLLSEGAISLILVHGDQGYSAAAANAAITLVRSHLDKHQMPSRQFRNVR